MALNTNGRIFERRQEFNGKVHESEGVTVIPRFIFDHLAEIINAMDVQDEKSLWADLPKDISYFLKKETCEQTINELERNRLDGLWEVGG